MKTRLITTSDIESIIALKSVDAFMDELIDCLRSGFLSLDAANSNIPVRTGLSYENPDIGLLEWMPAMVDQGKASLKIVGYHPSNPERFHIPTILSTLCIFDTDTGHLAGILDGTFATAARTGAMSAIATQQLCPEINDGIVGVIGCGAQAVTQLHALSRSMTIRKVIAYDTDESTSQSLQGRVPFLDAKIICLTKKELPYLLENADVICTCTSESPGLGPVFDDGDHKPHLHINAVGSDFPGKIEVPNSLLLRSMVVPDFAQQALKEGECQQLTRNEIECDLCGLLKSPQLQHDGKLRLSVFDSTGHAFADYLTGLFLIEQAERYNIGTPVQIECAPPDPKNPYSFLQESTKKKADSPMEAALRK